MNRLLTLRTRSTLAGTPSCGNVINRRGDRIDGARKLVEALQIRGAVARLVCIVRVERDVFDMRIRRL